MMKFFNIVAFLLFFPTFIIGNHLVDLIVFSYDRGVQLYATLESSERYFRGLNNIFVLYRTSESKYDLPYQDMKDRFKKVQWVKQGERAKQDFQPLLTNILRKSKADYILFAVDDIIVKDFVDLNRCVNALERTGAYGFYLRLGKNISYCYSAKVKSPLPPLKFVGDDVFMWQFSRGKGDWCYPNSVDMTLFRKNELLNDIARIRFAAPNGFEGSWSRVASLSLSGLCFSESKIINIPMNIVQSTYLHNPHMNFMSKEGFLKSYVDGFKIDISKLYKINNNSAHFELIPKFVRR